MEKIDIACMVNRAYSHYVEKYAGILGCEVDIFDGTMKSFYDDADLDKKSYDVLVLFSMDPYSDMEEARIKGVIDALREKENKDVTAAYLYKIPQEKIVDHNTDGVKIVKVTEDGTIAKMFDVRANYDVLDLLNDSLEFHNNGLKLGTPLMKDLVKREV